MNLNLDEILNTLQNTDLSDIDFNSFGTWPFVVKVIACILTFFLVLFIGYSFHLTDLQVQLAQLEDQEVSLKQQYATKAFQAAHLEAYRVQMKELEASFEALLHQLPRETEVPGLLEDITKTGLGSGLEFEEIKLQPEIPRQFYIELPIQITVLGDYHDLATFVASVTSMSRIVTLHDFALKPISAASDARLRLSILARTYRYSDQEAKK